MLSATAGPLRKKQLLLLVLPCPMFPALGNLKLVIVAAQLISGKGPSASLRTGFVHVVLRSFRRRRPEA